MMSGSEASEVVSTYVGMEMVALVAGLWPPHVHWEEEALGNLDRHFDGSFN